MGIIWQYSNELVDYDDALKQMEKTVHSIIAGTTEEKVWLLEHNSVYTAGSSASEAELLDKDRFPVYQPGRGGKYTYHGPGQRVAYFMLDLKKRFAPDVPDLKKYIWFLEQLIIETLREFDVESERRKDRIGIWVSTNKGEKKIASIGIRVKKWVAYHGVAINIAPNLSHFEGIIPCGITDYAVTSLEDLDKKIDMVYFDKVLRKNFNSIFGNIKCF
jgi:lipoyl(octanoyl) transferase